MSPLTLLILGKVSVRVEVFDHHFQGVSAAVLVILEFHASLGALSHEEAFASFGGRWLGVVRRIGLVKDLGRSLELHLWRRLHG